VSCGEVFRGREDLYGCERCGSLLQVVLDTSALRYEDLRTRWRERPIRVWRYREMLPVSGPEVSLEEGGTALLRVAALASSAPIHAFVKNEGQNPTGSFKDRGMTVGVTRARSQGRDRVICASTGNTAASLAAFASRAGMECIVLIPSGGIARGKLAQALFAGARVVSIRGTFDDAMRLVVKAAERLNAYILNSINPYRIEGQKTAAFEVFEQLGGRVPDWLVCPVGNGGNLAAYWKGFKELREIGAADRVPRLVGVQSEGSAPIADAILQKRDAIVPVANPVTVASAIRIGNPANWRKTIPAIRESDGMALKLPDAVILEAQGILARSEGLFVEPASAASLAGAMRLAREGTFDEGDRVVCVATGHGLKDPESALRAKGESLPIDADVDAIVRAVEGGAR
jgi:threonine synthase